MSQVFARRIKAEPRWTKCERANKQLFIFTSYLGGGGGGGGGGVEKINFTFS